MRRREPPTEKHTRLAGKLLDDARRGNWSGGFGAGQRKALGRDQPCLKAYCASHGLPHGKYADRRRAAMELAEQQDTPLIRSSFDLASSCHSNYHNDWMEQEDLDSCLISIEGLVQLILEARAR